MSEQSAAIPQRAAHSRKKVRYDSAVLRPPSRAFADQKKVFFVSLSGPSWFKKGVLRAPSRAFADQKKVFFVSLSGPSWFKKGVLRAPSRAFADKKKKFFVSLSGPSWFKRCSSRAFADRLTFFCSERPPLNVYEAWRTPNLSNASSSSSTPSPGSCGTLK